MPHIIEVTDLTAPELDVYARLTEAQLRNRLEPDKGVFIAESPKVIATALGGEIHHDGAGLHRRHGRDHHRQPAGQGTQRAAAGTT